MLGETPGTRCAFIMGTLDRPPVQAIVLWATASIGRWFRRGREGRGVFQLRGRETNERLLVCALQPSGAQYEEREPKEGCRRAVAGLTLGGEQTVLRVATLLALGRFFFSVFFLFFVIMHSLF